jgi:hypothetical protein
MDRDQKDLLSAFRAHGVKYLIVGGFAVIFHSQPRFTKDLDLLIWMDTENGRAAYAALADFGAPLDGISAEDLVDGRSFFRFGREPQGIDILSFIPGVEFEAAWERRVDAVVDAATGLMASFISAEDLIGAKVAAGRPQDFADADAVRKTNAILSEKQIGKVLE